MRIEMEKEKKAMQKQNKKAQQAKQIRLLITDNIPLYPPLQGGAHRIYNLYNPLPEKFVINYIGAASHRIEPIKARISELIIPASSSGKVNRLLVSAFGQNKRWLRGGSLYDLGLRFFMRSNRRFRREMDKMAEGSDILISSHPWFFTFIKGYKDKILVYDSHNCEYELLRDKMKGHLLGEMMVSWTRIVEREACRKSDLILACSETDKEQLVKHYGVREAKIHIVPNPVNTAEIKPASREERLKAKERLGLKGKKTVLFIATNFFANNTAANFIVDELARKMPDFTFLLAGSVKTHFEKTGKKLPANVILYGRVPQEDLLQLLKAADIAINPVLHGSGICIKSLDYMAAGLSIVSTPRGMRGIATNNNDKQDAIICSHDWFRREIIRLYGNEALRKRITRNARMLVEKEFDSKIVSRKLSGILENAKKE